MKVAIEGCCHGDLDAIYASILRAERDQGFQVDVVLICGDFQAIRNHADLNCLAVPQKYRRLGDFHRYYSGEKVAPILTLVIGGNHEASNYMWELYHGGWLAPNIYYLGAAGAVEVGGLTIAGASGIYKQHDYNRGRFERVPYDSSAIRSTYHTRRFDIERLKLLGSADIVLSHDWPNTIEQHGNTAALIKKKPFFRDEINTATLGSPPLLDLLQTLQPNYWFSAHLHVKFAALYKHGHESVATKSTSLTSDAVSSNPEAMSIDIDFDDEDGGDDNDDGTANKEQGTQSVPSPPPPNGNVRSDEIQSATSAHPETRFLALSKCLPHGHFLQFLDIPAPQDQQLSERKQQSNHQRVMPSFRFSKRWLAITKVLHPFFSLEYQQTPIPSLNDSQLLGQIKEQEKLIQDGLMDSHFPPQAEAGKPKADESKPSSVPATSSTDNVPETQNYHLLDLQPHSLDIYVTQQPIRTAPSPFEPGGLERGQPKWYTNPQTEAFCHLLQIENRINPRPPPVGFPSTGTMLPFHDPSPQGRFFQSQLSSFSETADGTRSSSYLADQSFLEQEARKKHKTDTTLATAPIATESDPNEIHIDLDGLDHEQDPTITTLDEFEAPIRWGEGAG